MVAGLAPAPGPGVLRGPGARTAVGGRELRLLATPTSTVEQILSALAGGAAACLGVLDAWAGHAEDLHVLVLASRGPADPVAVRPDEPRGPRAGPGDRPGAGRDAAPPRRRHRGHGRQRAGGARIRRPAGRADQPGQPAAGPAHRHGRRGLAGAAAGRGGARGRGGRGRGPAALHAALYGRVVATLRAWTGRPDLQVALTMIPEAAPRAWPATGPGWPPSCRSAGLPRCGPGAWAPAGTASAWPRRQTGTDGRCPP